jgi:hypothetical protein
MYALLAASIVQLLTSCATILNSTLTTTTVVVGENGAGISKNDTLQPIEGKVRLIVPRSAEPLELRIMSGGNSSTIIVPAQYSTFYLLNIPANYGLGMILDRRTVKRYTYSNYIYPDTNSISGYNSFGFENKKGQLFIHNSYPHFNSFMLSPQEETKANSNGFLGIALGLDYYYSSLRYLSLKTYGIMDFFLPFPAPVMRLGSYQIISSGGFEFSHHHCLGWLALGYGFLYQHYSWLKNTATTKEDFGPYTIERSSYPALGAVGSIYFQVTRKFHVGMVYRPTFYRPSRLDKYNYEHTLSIDFAWKFLLNRNK